MSGESKPGDFTLVDLAPGEKLVEKWWSKQVPIGMINLKDGAGSMDFAPQEDISSSEVALLLNLAVKLLMNRELGIPDWRSYLEQHGLARHFKPKEV